MERTLTRRPIGTGLLVVISVGVLALGLTPALESARTADAATITASYAVGHRDVRLNGYGASGLGAFTLRMDPGDPGSGDRLALCIEAHTSHSTTPGAYRLVENQLHSPQLDYLLWRYGWPGTAMSTPLGSDHDTATALGALAWFYADASRRGGGAVWAEPSSGAAVTPAHPHPWTALPADASIGLSASGQRLIRAEHRVYELYLEAEARRGPWAMSTIRHGDRTAAVTITGPAGPLAGIDGVRFLVRDHRGHAVVNEVAATDGAGVARVTVPPLVDGGTIEVSMFAPGIHQEWHGDGQIQRLATATTTRLDRSLPIAPQMRHVEVHKRSSDDTFGTSGARFELRDADGTRISTATSGADGRARFEPVDPSRHRPPYRIHETIAPPGLTAADRPVTVPAQLSTDRNRPTVVEITNHPTPHEIVVRKSLDDDRLGPTDRSGFEFEVIRSDDRSFGTATTGPDGTTPPILVTAGRFLVCERSKPPWATRTGDPGCIPLDVSDISPSRHEVGYVNLAPAPRISTRVRNGDTEETHHAEGAPVLLGPHGGPIVDVVSHQDLVPGTTYTLIGEVWAHTPDGSHRTGATGSTTFVPEAADGEVEVHFEIDGAELAGELPIEVGVVVQYLLVGDGDDGSEPVADHADLDDHAQTFWIPRIATEALLLDGESDTAALVDVGRLSGLPPGRYRSEVRWHERLDDGTCRATDAVAETWFEPDGDHRAEVGVGPITVWSEAAGSTLVAFHRVELHVEGDAPRVVTEHADCDAVEQTVHVPAAHVEDDEPAPTTTPTTPTTTSPPPTTRPEPVVDQVEAVEEEHVEVEVVVDAPVPVRSIPSPPASPHRPLPRTGQDMEISGGLALMLLGAGGLVALAAVRDRRRLAR